MVKSEFQSIYKLHDFIQDNKLNFLLIFGKLNFKQLKQNTFLYCFQLFLYIGKKLQVFYNFC